MKSRRQLLQASLLTAAAPALLPAAPVGPGSGITLQQGDVVLFQGDSITDARRDRKQQATANDARMLGYGYPAHVAASLLLAKPELGLKIFNRGISGNKVPQLNERWEEDTLSLKPSLLSILIGVNDFWHTLDGRFDGTAESYRDGFSALLQRTRKTLPQVKLVVCEPFVLRCGHITDRWFPEFDKRRAYALEVAQKAGAVWVPFQSMFDEAIAAGTPASYWAPDGVHPSVAGHALMARTWREHVGV